MIASDKEGEVLAYGTTVPYVTTLTKRRKIEEDAAYLVDKLVQNHEQFLATANKEDAPGVTIPVPIQPLPEDSLHDLQMRALEVVTVVGECLQTAGYALSSVTPIVMAETDESDHIRSGYLVTACKKENEKYAMGTGSAEDIAYTWTERANYYYGRAAVQRFQEEMAHNVRQALSEMTGQNSSDGTDKTVH